MLDPYEEKGMASSCLIYVAFALLFFICFDYGHMPSTTVSALQRKATCGLWSLTQCYLIQIGL